MKNLKYIAILSVLSGYLAGCGSSNELELSAPSQVEVEVSTASSIEKSATISVSGRIQAAESANVSTRMMGNITTLKVQVGDQVAKGELLLTLSNADLVAKRAQVEASIAQAQSGFENASKDLKRFQTLFEKGSASEKELENMTTRYEMAKAGLEGANQMKNEVNAQFVFTNIRAPFDGVVGNTFVKEGDLASPGMPLISIEGRGAYQAMVMVPESTISGIALGAKAEVLIKSVNQKMEGIVSEVSPSSKNTGGQYLVKIDLPSAQNILPGRFVNAEIELSGSKQKMTSPLVDESALVHKGQLVGLYSVSANNTAILRWIRTGTIQNGKVEVLSGISDGEQYVSKVSGKLYNGASLAVRN